MSTQLPTDSDLRDYAESRDTVIITATNGTDKHLHLPDKEGTNPLCDREAKRAWLVKTPAVYPEGFLPWCTHCANQAVERGLL